MSFMTTLKEKLGMSKDKAGDTMDKKTGGKYGDKIDSGVKKAKGAVDDYGKKGEGSS